MCLQKMKLLFLMEMLRQDSDEAHPMTTKVICTRLAEKGISCDRRTLAKDIQVLNEQGYEVMSRMCGHEKDYYVDDRRFSVPELKILIDAVQRGLELKVYDNRSPDTEGRSVAMLSGGEKFLVSLSLSIGMSTVAQKTGVQIEALFIDEGFGTLDDSSIHDAMDILESVRRSSGMIGIIIHVQLLENNIPTHLEVIKANGGSTIVPV